MSHSVVMRMKIETPSFTQTLLREH